MGVTGLKARRVKCTQYLFSNLLFMETSTTLTDLELYKLCQEYGLNARKWTKKFAALLPEVNKRQLYLKHGMLSVYEFAAKVGGMSNAAVEQVLAVSRKLEDKPALKNLIATKGWSKLRVITSVATVENQAMLAEKVKLQSKNTLELYVKEAKNQGLLPQNHEKSEKQIFPGEKLSTLSFDVSPETETRMRILKQKLQKEAKQKLTWEQVMQKMLETMENAEAAETTHVAKKAKKPRPVPSKQEIQKSLVAAKPARPAGQGVATKLTKPSRYIPASVRSYLKQQYKGRCAYPSCNKPSEILHHTRRFALNPSHDPDYIKPLCKNHERIAHQGLIKHEELSPEHWQVKLKPTEGPKAKIDAKVNRFRLAWS